MTQEIGKLFVPPTTLYRDLRAEHLAGFRSLQRMQYGFSEESLDRSMLSLQMENYWEQLRSQVLSVVSNPTHPRFRQIGFAMGYSFGGIYHIFQDGVITNLSDREILVIKKTLICPEAGIRVQILDGDWEHVVEEGAVVGYEVNSQGQQPPRFSFVLQFGDQRRKHPDWGGFCDGRFRFDVPNLDRN